MPCAGAAAGGESPPFASAAARRWRSRSSSWARIARSSTGDRIVKVQDARAVVTGGASGLGLAVARRLVALGGKVTLLDVQDGPGRAAASELGANAAFLRCDVTSEAEVGAAMEGA